jgi:hypothetical protein
MTNKTDTTPEAIPLCAPSAPICSTEDLGFSLKLSKEDMAYLNRVQRRILPTGRRYYFD